ncbi:MAG TPA: hypothetical protein VNJ52_03980 [Patescibacteria group bacterium]|nr:hypothetical protein [Patescibacteria group bacterium]
MDGKGSLLLVCCAWVAFQPALRAAPPPAIGTVIGRGEIRVNGVSVPSGAVLCSGDRIVTSSAGAAAVYLIGGEKLALSAATVTRVGANGKGFIVRLDRGRVAAIGGKDSAIVVRANGISVESKQAGGSYQAAWTGGSLEVLGRSGVTLVSGANRTVAVSAGSLMKASVVRGKSPAKRGKILLITLIAAAGAGVGAGLALTAPGPSCVSASELTCP